MVAGVLASFDLASAHCAVTREMALPTGATLEELTERIAHSNVHFYITALADRFLVVSKESIMTPQGGLGGIRGGIRGSAAGLVFSKQ